MPVLTAIFLLTFMVSACESSQHSRFSPGNPRNLLDNSSERVSFSLNTPGAIDDISSWIDRDQPTYAELGCSANSYPCKQAQETLEQFGVSYKFISGQPGTSKISLIYDRIIARDCDSRYVDNRFNPSNKNHVTFGCSVAANSIVMTGNHADFTNPALMNVQDAEKAAAVFNHYLKGKKKRSCHTGKCGK